MISKSKRRIFAKRHWNQFCLQLENILGKLNLKKVSDSHMNHIFGIIDESRIDRAYNVRAKLDRRVSFFVLLVVDYSHYMGGT